MPISIKTIAFFTKEAYNINSQIDADNFEDDHKDLKQIRYYKNKETDAEFICFETIENIKLIIFKGTNSSIDLKYDLDFLPFEILKNHDSFYAEKNIKKTGFKLHSGFLKQFLSIKDKFDDELNESSKIILTGHSLGAALATIASAYMFFYIPNRIYQIILFGSPRVLCKEFAEWYDKRLSSKTIKFVDVLDPIVYLPPTGNILEYQHVDGTIIKFRGGNIISDNECYLKNVYNYCKGIFYRGHEHFMKNYLKDIEKHSLFNKINF